MMYINLKIKNLEKTLFMVIFNHVKTVNITNIFNKN